MLGIATKLLVQRQLRFEAGHMILLGQKICMMPIHTIGKIQLELKRHKSENFIYYATKESGYDWWKGMKKKFHTTKINEMLEWGIKIMSLAGWGNVTILKVDSENKEITYKIENSSIASYIGRSGDSEDHIFRGYLAGSNEYFFAVESDAIEVKCTSKGDSYCVIIAKPTKALTQKDKDVSRQLKLPPHSKIKTTNIQ